MQDGDGLRSKHGRSQNVLFWYLKVAFDEKSVSERNAIRLAVMLKLWCTFWTSGLPKFIESVRSERVSPNIEHATT